MQKILIVEDCNTQANVIKELLLMGLPDVYVFITNQYSQALDISKENDIDLFFLDINIGLNQKNGIELAEELRKFEKYSLTWMVFISGYASHMLQAFKKVNCYDFITKPCLPSEIQRVAAKLLGYKEKELTSHTHFSFVNSENKKTQVMKSDIFYIESKNKKCAIHSQSQVFTTQRKSLIAVAKEINMKTLVQSHKSFFININKIEKINENKPCSEIFFSNYDKTALLGRKFWSINKSKFLMAKYG
ncbi:MAG: LytR/AlgR family response regulator transcription factor [Alkaliphilus sp.]